MIVVFVAILALVQATSVLLGDNKLRHLSPVSNLDVFGSSILDPLTISFRVPLEHHLSNIERRWYVQADPNAMDQLVSLNSPMMGDSSALFGYLTRNSSVEVPSEYLDFKIALFPHEQRTIMVNGEEFDDMNTAQGTAYRKIQTTTGEYWKPIGWARFSLHNDTDRINFKGAFQVGEDSGLGFPTTVYHLSTVEHIQSQLSQDEIHGHLRRRANTDDYVVWRDFDVRETTRGTPLSNLHDYGLNDYTFLEGMSSGHLFRRADDNDTASGSTSGMNLYNYIGDSSGCPTKRQVALIGLLADCNLVADFNTTSSLRQHLLDVVNQASQLYENAFNITLGLSDIVIANNGTCPDVGTTDQPWNYKCVDGSNAISDRLDNVTTWRSTRSNDSIATWSLMTKCDAGSVVGLSWLGTVCEGASGGASGTNVITRTSLDYLVLAHEIGHSFGAVHDCTSDTCDSKLDQTSECCPRSKDQCVGTDGLVFVMNPASVESIGNFSACSQGNICGKMLLKSVNTTCFRANSGGINLYTNNTCGNGIVEEGEECDCGGVDGCGDNSCCDPLTCKFKNNAVCDDSNDECCSGCQYASSDTVCRASTGPCDQPEYCTGNSTVCPSDEYSADGVSCTLNTTSLTGLTCISGQCSSRDLQCRNIMSGYQTSDGSSLKDVKACSQDTSCRMVCQGSNSNCFQFSTSTYFRDGTPCDGTGRCSHGQCIGGSSTTNSIFGDDGSNGSFPWRWVVVAVGIFVVMLLIAAVYGIMTSCIRGGGTHWGTLRPAPKPVVPPPGLANSPAPGPSMAVPSYYDRNFSPVQPNSYYYTDLNYPEPPPQAYYRSQQYDNPYYYSPQEPVAPPPPPPPPPPGTSR